MHRSRTAWVTASTGISRKASPPHIKIPKSATRVPGEFAGAAQATISTRRGEAALQEKEKQMTVKEGWRGRFFEDFEVGDIYKHPFGRTNTTTHKIWFTLLTQNTAPIHV